MISPTQLPRIGTKSDFANLRSLLLANDYCESSIASRLDFPSTQALDLITAGKCSLSAGAECDVLNLLIRLFLLGECAAKKELESLIPPPVLESIVNLALLITDPADSARVFASVAMYPLGSNYFISDRWNNPDLTPRQSFPDVVYPALTKSTREFLHFLSFVPCEDFLEVCSGSGIAAITASRNATNVWAADITERSAHFARFNVALNEASNVVVLKGDLFEPCGSRQFDRIAAHPPYMPVLSPAEIYYDGGEDGESLTRRIVQDLPRRLKPGGRLYCRTLGSDRIDSSYEEWVRSWLGDSQGEFDVAFFVSKNLAVTKFAVDSAIRRAGGQDEVSAWLTQFKRLGISELLSGILILQRRIGLRPVFTLRRSLSTNASRCDTESVLHWQTRFSEAGEEDQIFDLCPVASPTLRFVATHALKNGEIVLKSFKITNDFPFLMDLEAEPWLGQLIALCDGTRSIRVLSKCSRESAWIHPETPLREFGGMVFLLGSSGYVQLPAAEGVGHATSERDSKPRP
jgi:SAM-dependent methyltransferase